MENIHNSGSKVKIFNASGRKAEDEAKASIISEKAEQRDALGLSQRDIAVLCDMQQSTVARIEACKTNPTLDSLLRNMRSLRLALTVTPLKAKKNHHLNVHLTQLVCLLGFFHFYCRQFLFCLC